ncbi:uncharacterized protein LOC143540556 [Bidens hawaiensis]|uniref:uncharacterized protein LOC143540556 n=1 Tax=Bidens hawaiensis TaxID=980011 RepID=UPI00404B83E2
MSSMVSQQDLGWKYSYMTNLEDKNTLTCKFCHKDTNAGIFRLKFHLIGGNRNVKKCDKCPKEVKEELKVKEKWFKQALMMLVIKRCKMIADVGKYGSHLKPPIFHELRVPLLKNEVEKVDQWVEEQKPEWSKYGCSIMLDEWTDRKQRTLINFWSTFQRELCLWSPLTRPPEDRSSYKLAGKMLMDKRKSLFWAPCAAHCFDLMLEDIGNISKVKATIENGVFLVGYINNHIFVLNMMRELTKDNELARCGVTRFAITYLTLQSSQKKKSALRNMFTSEKWTNRKWAKEHK